MGVIAAAARALALAASAAAALVALTGWMVRRGHLPPFGAWPRLVRRLSDPLLRPIERGLVRAGGNPQDAPAWMLGFAVIGGLVLIAAADWLAALAARQGVGAGAGPRDVAAFLIQGSYTVLVVGLVARAIASWVGLGASHPMLRPLVWLTEWLVGPIRRRLPPTGMIDLSPLVAFLVLLVARTLLLRVVR